jgi:hypothetical protein
MCSPGKYENGLRTGCTDCAADFDSAEGSSVASECSACVVPKFSNAGEACGSCVVNQFRNGYACETVGQKVNLVINEVWLNTDNILSERGAEPPDLKDFLVGELLRADGAGSQFPDYPSEWYTDSAKLESDPERLRECVRERSERKKELATATHRRTNELLLCVRAKRAQKRASEAAHQ